MPLISNKHENIFKSLIFTSLLCISSLAAAQSAQYYVSTTGSDDIGDGSLANPWQSVQKAMFTVPFDVDAADINLREGTYVLKTGGVFINELRGGSNNGTFRIKNYNNENAVVDGRNIDTFGAMFTIVNANNVTLEGLEITNLTGNKSGIHISGSSSKINIFENEIHGMRWTTNTTDANSPAPSDNLNPVVVLGNSETSATNISIMDNVMYDLTTGFSEAVKVVGNVDGFIVEGNRISDVTNICIVAAGNYDYVGVSAAVNHARNGIIRYNETYRCVSPIAASAGIYADGAKDIFITENYSHNNTVGFSVGSEQVGEASGIILSRNDSARNTQAGLVLGTNTNGATVSDIIITENEFRGNFTDVVSGGAPLIFSNAKNVTISDNDISSINEFMITSNGLVSNLNINRNKYSSGTVEPSAAVFTWTGISGEVYFSFDSYKSATGQDNRSTFND